MAQINSIPGPLDSAQLGRTLIHEHLLIRSELVVLQFPHLYDEAHEFRQAVASVRAVQQHGVATICDPTIPGLGRDVRFIEKVVQETGIQVIMGTGIYTFNEIPHRFQTRDADYLADIFVRDIEIGMQNTSMKAGFLKCVTDAQGITPDIEKTIRAVARAHGKTGVPIMTHSHPASGMGLRQLDILEEEGVNPDKVLIGHSGDTDNIDYILSVLDRGAYIGMDRYGITRTVTNEQRNETVIELVNRGYADRMFLSQDYCCTSELHKPEEVMKTYYEKWSMTYLFEEVIPALKERGVTDEHIHTMLVDNVKRWFEGK